MRRCCLILLCFAFLPLWVALAVSPRELRASGQAVASKESLEDSIVQVTVAFQEPDPFMPWRMLEPAERWGYGVVIGTNRILTTERLVRNSTHIELRKAEEGEKFTAVVEQADYQANLALLSVKASEAIGRLVPLRLASEPVASNEMEIAQFEIDKIQRGKAQLINVSVAHLPSAPYPSLAFSVLTDLNVEADGAPLLSRGQLVGLVMHFDSSARRALVLPYPVLQKFVEDVANPPYEGQASAGFIWKPLLDPAKRAFLGVKQPGRGVLVLTALPSTSASEVLQPEDVIIRFGEYDVDNLGFYIDPEWGRLLLPYLIKGRGKPGDVVPIAIVRNGKEETVQLKLVRQTDDDALIPENIENRQVDYVVEGGLIIRELTGRYLRSQGSWMATANPQMVHLYLAGRYDRSNAMERIVILSGVLPDPINVGYEDINNRIIEAINSKRVQNMDDVFKILADDGNIERVRLKSFGVELVLDRSKIREANERLSHFYRIPELRHRSGLRL